MSHDVLGKTLYCTISVLAKCSNVLPVTILVLQFPFLLFLGTYPLQILKKRKNLKYRGYLINPAVLELRSLG